MDNFYDTANRMLKSSNTLHNDQDFHNSCYLAGYVIECYLKIIVSAFSSKSPRLFSHNISSLDSYLQSILNGNSTLSQYILNGSSDFLMVSTYWKPGDLRYSDVLNSISNQAISDGFQNEIKLAMQKIAQLKIDGHI